MKILWILAFRNLLRNKRRSLSTGIAMCSGFVGLVLLSAYIYRVQQGLAASTIYLNFKGHISIFHQDGLEKFFSKPSKYQLNRDEKNEIYDVLKTYENKIEYTGEFISGSGLLSSGNKSTPVLMTGFEPEVFYKSYNHPTLKKWAKDWLVQGSDHKEFIENKDLISVTKSLAEIIGKSSITLSSSENEREIQLASKTFSNDLNAVNAMLGTYHSTGIALAEDTSLLAPISLLQNLFDTKGAHYISLFLKNSSDIRSLLASLKNDFQTRNLKLDVYPYYDENVGYFFVGTMGFLYVMGLFFVFLILSAVILSIINSTTMGIIERSREIGTLRAIGFKPRDIKKLFIFESLWLGFFSVIFGIAISLVISQIVNHINIRFSPPGVSGTVQLFLAIEPFLLISLSIILTIASTLSTYFVIRNKSKIKVIELLTESGA